jgi:hypothetical protein
LIRGFEKAQEMCERAIETDDETELREETNQLCSFLTDTVGEIVDLNLDFFPEKIVVTFVKHEDV